jgi:hypothetical protein
LRGGRACDRRRADQRERRVGESASHFGVPVGANRRSQV